jgi:hypothetical protein
MLTAVVAVVFLTGAECSIRCAALLSQRLPAGAYFPISVRFNGLFGRGKASGSNDRFGIAGLAASC